MLVFRQFKFDKGLTRGKNKTMKAQQPGVSQDVWDCLFPSAKGKQAFLIQDYTETFGVARSYFRREMRYGSVMGVNKMEASLNAAGVLTVKGSYGLGSLWSF